MRALPIRGRRYQIGIEDAPTTEPVLSGLSRAQFLAGPGATLEHAVRLLTLAGMFVLDSLAVILLLASAAPMRSAAAATRY